MQAKAIFFDLDGTLVHTAPEITDALNNALRQLGHTEVEQDLVQRWIGQGTQELLVQALAYSTAYSAQQVRASALLQHALPIFNHAYMRCCGSRSQPYAQVHQTLTVLRQRNCHLAVITNKEQRYTQPVLDAHALSGYFDLVICGDTFAHKKPNPVGVLHALSQWQLAPNDAMFVGDSCIDAATARNAGIPVWLLPYGYNMGQPVHSCQPDRVIENISELL